MTSYATVIQFKSPEHGALIPYLAALHAQCITYDRIMATFLPPLTNEKLLAWWKEKLQESSRNERVIFLLLEGQAVDGPPAGSGLVGVVMLNMYSSETGPFRASVEKLFIHTRFRERGGARALMDALEIEAMQRGKTLLVRTLAWELYIELTRTDAGRTSRKYRTGRL